jgi:hypothetical protein
MRAVWWRLFILMAKLIEMPDIRIREYPLAQNPFLRYQIGRMETRPITLPCFEGRLLVGHRVGRKQVSVFHLLGWGDTQEKAEALANAVLRPTKKLEPKKGDVEFV